MADARGAMARAVGTSLAATKPGREREALVALARHYARLIDAAAPAARYEAAIAAVDRAVSAAVEQAARASEGEAIARGWRTIRDALAAHSVASDIGPKLLSTLAALGLSVGSAQVPTGGEPGGPPAPAAQSTTDRLREQRRIREERARLHRSEDLDSAAT